jgi:RNA polymerase primary sigma factor
MAIDSQVEVYLREVADIPLLTPAAETRLIAHIRQGGSDVKTAKRDLIEGHLHEVVSIVKEYSHDPQRWLDLISEGNLGLIRAADDLDHLRDVSFSAHAVRYIRPAMADASSPK